MNVMCCCLCIVCLLPHFVHLLIIALVLRQITVSCLHSSWSLFCVACTVHYVAHCCWCAALRCPACTVPYNSAVRNAISHITCVHMALRWLEWWTKLSTALSCERNAFGWVDNVILLSLSSVPWILNLLLTSPCAELVSAGLFCQFSCAYSIL